MGTARDAVRQWPNAAWSAWPDLVVIHHGINEARSAIVPPVIHRMAWTLDRSDRWAEAKARRILQGKWPLFTRTARKLDRPYVPGHVSSARFRRQMERLVGQTIAHTRAICVVIGINPVNELLTGLGAHYGYRRDRLENELEEVCGAYPRTRLVRLSEVQAELGTSELAFPDGIHLSAEAHLAVARKIAAAFWDLRGREAAHTVEAQR